MRFTAVQISASCIQGGIVRCGDISQTSRDE